MLAVPVAACFYKTRLTNWSQDKDQDVRLYSLLCMSAVLVAVDWL